MLLRVLLLRASELLLGAALLLLQWAAVCQRWTWGTSHTYK
jgi:hypothetical protein